MAWPRPVQVPSVRAEAEPHGGDDGGSRLVPLGRQRGFEIGHERCAKGSVRLGARDDLPDLRTGLRSSCAALTQPSGGAGSSLSSSAIRSSS